MAFRKENALKSAERLVAKGKLEAAIKEYRKILEKVGDDINISNLVGDLYARLRKADEAIKFYSQTAEKYSQDGFYARAIAVYKKAHRLNPEQLTVRLKLAELYQAQNLLNDARDQYQSAADRYQQLGDGASAINVYQKLVQMEPEDPSHHARLAELYRQEHLLGKAIREYGAIAKQMISHEQFDQAVQVYLRALDIESTDLEFIGTALDDLYDGGSREAAEELLRAAVERNAAAEGLGSRLTAKAEAAAAKIAAEEAEAAAQEAAQKAAAEKAAAEKAAAEREAAAQAAPPVAPPTPTPSPAATASPAARATPGGADYEEFVLDLDEEEPPTSLVQPPADVIEADRAGGEASRPAWAEPELLDHDGEIELELDEDLGQPAPPGVAEAPPAIEPASAPEAPPGPAVPPQSPPSVATGPAAPPPERVASPMAATPEPSGPAPIQIPEDIELELDDDLSHLDNAGAAPADPAPAEIAPEAIELELTDTGDSFAQELGPPPEPAPLVDAPPPSGPSMETVLALEEVEPQPLVAEPPEPLPVPAPPPAEVVAPPPTSLPFPAAPPVSAPPPASSPPVAARDSSALGREDDLLAEAEVFVKYGLTEKAVDRLEEVLGLNPRHLAANAELVTLYHQQGRLQEAADIANRVGALAREVGAPSLWEKVKEVLLGAGYRMDGEAIVGLPGGGGAVMAPEAPPPQEPSTTTAIPVTGVTAPSSPAAEAPPPAIELPPPLPAQPAQPPAAAAPPPVESESSWLDALPTDEPGGQTEDSLFEEDQFFDLATELQGELEEPSGRNEPREQTLEEIVEGFKKGVAENLSPEESDTHYNLGIAYREMLLLDEAIGEFQIAAKDPKYLVESCSMLGLCFREKGLQDLAVKWYQRALESDQIREEQLLGMLYDKASVLVELNDLDTAYRTFLELYGRDSSYRDVAARVQELEPSRSV